MMKFEFFEGELFDIHAKETRGILTHEEAKKKANELLKNPRFNSKDVDSFSNELRRYNYL